jgi:hypothetical protein
MIFYHANSDNVSFVPRRLQDHSLVRQPPWRTIVSASIYSRLRNCQALPTITRRMTFWQAIQGVVRH